MLWFESDLYDQLQLIQVLDRLGRMARRPPAHLVRIPDDPSTGRFRRSRGSAPAPLLAYFAAREPVTEVMVALASRAWLAFRSPRPAGEDFLAQDLTLTAAGRAVLSGTADAVALRGIDRWLGGVRLSGRHGVWRWEPGTGVLRRA